MQVVRVPACHAHRPTYAIGTAPAAFAPKWKSKPTHERNTGTERANQEFRLLASWWKGDNRIDAGFREHLQASSRFDMSLRKALGMEHLVGIDIERERDGLPAVYRAVSLRTGQAGTDGPRCTPSNTPNAHEAPSKIPDRTFRRPYRICATKHPPFETRSMP